ncbi:MAG: hypothetical protein EXR78_06455 [Deltaproteobacteria bacterium]|nr:hypothetical protein [Deltaproteobacteria bacterium]
MQRTLPLWFLSLILLCHGFIPSAGYARVTRVLIEKIESPMFTGQSFGTAGPYEKLTGRVFGEVDPTAPENAGIVNLDKAPRTAAGRVAYSADLYVLKPVDLTKGNRKMFYGVLNRGNKIDLVLMNNAPSGPQTNDPTTGADVGNGFLLRQGYTLVWSGWQARGKTGAQCCVDTSPSLMGAELPIPLNNNQPIVGNVRDLFVGRQQSNAPDHTTATLSYPTARQDPEAIRVTVRTKADKELSQPIPACKADAKVFRCWHLVDEQTVSIMPQFESGLLYEFVYPGKNPPVLGLGFAITRDVVSFLRYGSTDEQNTPNPLRLSAREGGIQKVLALGISQAGRYLQEHIYNGFNQDEKKRIVFDGVLIDIAGAGKTFTNFAFGQPGRTRGSHQDSDFPENWFPFAYGSQTDPLTEKQDGILRNGSGKVGDGFDPVVMVTNTATEYWRKGASLLHTDTAGNDVPIPDNVRLYFFASTQHFPIFPQITTSLGERLPSGPCQYPQNPAFRGPVMRALFSALDQWVTTGTPPPESRVPTRQAGTLVPAEESVAAFPKIPGVTHIGQPTPTYALYGSVALKTPQTQYPTLVPKPNASGNDLAGIQVPDIAVPIGTHTGWAVRADVPDAMCGNLGQFIPFAYSRSQRNQARDPRLSLLDRYPKKTSYLKQMKQVVTDLQTQRLLLEEDAATYMADAERKVTAIFTPPPKPPKEKPRGTVNEGSADAGGKSPPWVLLFSPNIDSHGIRAE